MKLTNHKKINSEKSKRLRWAKMGKLHHNQEAVRNEKSKGCSIF